MNDDMVIIGIGINGFVAYRNSDKNYKLCRVFDDRMSTNPFQERGILTPSNVDFLTGDKTHSTPQERSKERKRIRERVAAALHDFEILCEYWEEEQQRDTIDLIEETGNKSLEELGAEFVSFLYMLYNIENSDPNIVTDGDPEEKLLRFRSSLSRGIRKGKRMFGDSSEVVSVATTTRLYETPDPDEVRDEINTEVLTDAHRKINQKYRRSELYEDDELIVDERETVVEDLFLEWEELVTSEIVERRMKADKFIRPPGTSITNVQGYRDEFKKEPGSQSD